MKKSYWFVVSLCIVVFLVGCQENQVHNEIILPVGYIPSVQFAPFYVGIANGYYEDVGISLEMQYGFEIDGVSLVGSGELPFAVASGEQVVLAKDKGLPVIYVMNWYKDYPVGITVMKDSGIQELSELSDRVIGIPALQGASYIAYKGFESTGTFDPDSITLEVIGYNQVEMLSQGQVDAAVIYITNTPVVLTSQGYDVVTFPISDYISLVGNGIIANQEVLENDPDLVSDFIQATWRAIEFVRDNPEQTYEICKDFVPNLEEQTVQYQVLLASIPLWSTNGGYSDAQAWAATTQLVKRLDLVSDSITADELFTNNFVK